MNAAGIQAKIDELTSKLHNDNRETRDQSGRKLHNDVLKQRLAWKVERKTLRDELLKLALEAEAEADVRPVAAVEKDIETQMAIIRTAKAKARALNRERDRALMAEKVSTMPEHAKAAMRKLLTKK